MQLLQGKVHWLEADWRIVASSLARHSVEVSMALEWLRGLASAQVAVLGLLLMGPLRSKGHFLATLGMQHLLSSAGILEGRFRGCSVQSPIHVPCVG